MPDSVSQKTWRDVVAAMPTGSLVVNLDDFRGSSCLVGIHVDDEHGCLRVDYSIGSQWLKKEAVEGTIRIPLSVEFLEEGSGTKDHRFIANYDDTTITIYVTKRLPKN